MQEGGLPWVCWGSLTSRGYELLVVGDCRVVYEGVGDHDECDLEGLLVRTRSVGGKREVTGGEGSSQMDAWLMFVNRRR